MKSVGKQLKGELFTAPTRSAVFSNANFEIHMEIIELLCEFVSQMLWIDPNIECVSEWNVKLEQSKWKHQFESFSLFHIGWMFVDIEYLYKIEDEPLFDHLTLVIRVYLTKCWALQKKKKCNCSKQTNALASSSCLQHGNHLVCCIYCMFFFIVQCLSPQFLSFILFQWFYFSSQPNIIRLRFKSSV